MSQPVSSITVRVLSVLKGIFAVVAVLGFMLILVGIYVFRDVSKPEPELPTVDGPEVTHLSSKTEGCLLLYTPYPDALVGNEISTNRSFETTTKLRRMMPWCRERCSADQIDGPDEDGILAFMESNRFGVKSGGIKFGLMTIRLGEAEPTEIFSRSGYPNVADLALSPRGGKIAFLTIDPKSAEIPGTYRKPGVIEIWDAAQRRGGPTTITALQVGISWFPDGKRLAYVGALGDELETVFVLNVETGDRTPILFQEEDSTPQRPLKGDFPIVSRDGSSILIAPVNRDCCNRGKTFQFVDLQSGFAKTVSLPTRSRAGPIALLSDGIVLYRGLPTTGMAQKLDFRKYRMETYKLSDMKTGEFQTVVPYVEHNTSGGYGSCKGFYPASGEIKPNQKQLQDRGALAPVSDTRIPQEKEKPSRRHRRNTGGFHRSQPR